jgi:predicted lipoprotein with Yx(FWY)xxD motif
MSLRAGLAIAVATTLAACGGAKAAEPGTGAAPAPTTAAATAAATIPTAAHAPAAVRAKAPTGPPTIAVRSAPGYAKLLVDGAGRTLYLFTADRGPASLCRGACAVAWPPLIVHGTPRAGGGLQPSKLSVIRRAGGQRQLAYNGHPLYYYVGDRRPGQILCQDAEEYGGHWWLVKPSGQINRS